MNYKIVKFNFSAPLHLGDERLEDSGFSIHSDTLFSALCIEAINILGEDGIHQLYNAVMEDDLLISDGLPFIGEELYLPKPILKIEPGESGNSSIRKLYKKLQFIPVGELLPYLRGKLDVHKAVQKLDTLGVSDIYTSAVINRTSETDPMPYSVGIYNFCKNNGIYFVIGYGAEDTFDFVMRILDSLSYRGIGGKVSAGLGKFKVKYEDISDIYKNLLDNKGNKFMTISGCLPKESELQNALKGASYITVKRSGFVASSDFSETAVKKADLYVLGAGSCFTNSFDGDIYDVGPNGNHPVYRYAKPMMLGVE